MNLFLVLCLKPFLRFHCFILVTDLLSSGFETVSVIDFRIADDIVENCLLDVCSELEDISKDIVSHVYRSEFELVPAN